LTDVVVLERYSIACAAGGKGGGFLAGTWGDGGITQDMHRTSFQLHEDIAKTLNIESYRKIDVLSVNGRRKGDNVATWLDGPTVSSTIMDRGTAQVSPYELTTKMMTAAEANGAKVVIGTASGLTLSHSGAVTGVQLEGGGELDCDAVVVAMGAWSTLLEDWGVGQGLKVPMQGVKSTSLVYKDLPAVAIEEPYALFCAEDSRYHTHLEVYPRPNGEVYICGCGGSDYVTKERLSKGGDCESPEQILADPLRVQAASQAFESMLPGALAQRHGGKNLGPQTVQACMRPCAPDALPILGPVQGTKGLYIATGHNCWGILWAPVTGLIIAEILTEGGSKTVDISAFSPQRFMPTYSGRGRARRDEDVGEQW